ncbi:hypothetical protein [Variovorax sp. DXTD-1]|uniref:hypothetical protein n=1 Tax=Variovorax sp. DXTD-1 TaxID=2495592 RepID=UPI00163C1B59|nr:hypothetical protein [Variovorax sp. DXTD-1]
MTHENRSLRVASQNGKVARSVLVLERQLPPNLIQLKLMLRVNVLDGVTPQT